ncbi:MAG: bifunctional GTP diphosphokinase/guanosine-3',5'-bis(diphosphate) 3'-diphosphatase [Gammaproteobacteria bacterium]|nr:MAG: bifunctional GTP diphosphokinase/guanosine-3',5'-bis(diphosphate) 3'-diphosphatase [Gammaproteobacteria bacterium]
MCIADQSFSELSEILRFYLDEDKFGLVREAYLFAKDAHEGQYRKSGEPYIVHPVAVAVILANMKMDYHILMAALLHDVIEDTEVTYQLLADRFGSTIANLVDGVSKLTQIKFRTRAEAQAENFQKMTLAMAKDPQVILLKLADRLHNMRTLGSLNFEKRSRIATETLDIYAPIARRLGINSIRTELEDLGFATLYPMRARLIKKAVEERRHNRKEIVSEIKFSLEEKMQERGLKGVVLVRERHLNSIYQKMKKMSFQEVMDIYAFRVVVESEDDCYRSLGVAHSLYRPRIELFKDYIATPKENGYQSLHTTLIGMHRVYIEIQILTADMEAHANNGIASRWVYDTRMSETPTHNQSGVDRWLDGLMQINKFTGNSLEFIEHVKTDLKVNRGEVRVFTPNSEAIELPAGATAVDFAYAIHTDVGNACVACRVDKTLYPLSSPLPNGVVLEIITASGARPSPAWLDFVVTGRAKSSIRHFLRHQKQAESVELGRKLLKRSLKSFDKKLSKISEKQRERVARHNQSSCFEELLEEIGLGNRMPFIIARQLLSDELRAADDTADIDKDARTSALTIDGTGGLVNIFAKCCKPIPGDPIVGIMDSGKGMVIHSETCDQVVRSGSQKQQLVYLKWKKEDITNEFAVALRVVLEWRRGIIAELAGAVAMADSSVEKISVKERGAKLSFVNLIVHVQGRIHLARVMKRIRNMRAVTSITRIRN